MKKLSLLLVTISFSLLAFAKPLSEGYVRSSVYELEGQLSDNLEKQIAQFSGMENLWVSVKFGLDVEGLVKFLDEQSAPAAKEKTKYPELPGLNFGADGAEVVDDVENQKVIMIDNSKLTVDAANIFAFTSKLNVTIYHKGQVERKVERLVRSMVEDKLSSLRVPVEVKFNHRIARPLENTDYSEGQKVRFETDSFAKSLEQGVVQSSKTLTSGVKIKAWLFLAAFLLASVFGVFCYIFMRGLGQVNEALSIIAKSIQSQGQNGTISTSSNSEANKIFEKEEIETSSSVTELDFRQKIIEIYDANSETISNFFSISMENKSFHDIWCLSQVLGEKLNFENAKISNSKNFKEYNRFLRSNLFSESSFHDYKLLYQKLMGLMLYPGVYFHNNIKEKLTHLNLQDLGLFFQSLSKEEKGVVAEVVDPLVLAGLINQGMVHASEIIDFSHQDMDVSSLKRLDQKASQFVQEKQTFEEDKILEVLTYLNQEQFDSHIEEWGVAENFSFSHLFEAKLQEANEFFKGLRVEELCALLPMLRPEIQNRVESILPDIKRARINQAGKKTNSQSSELMAKLFGILIDRDTKSMFLSELSKDSTKASLNIAA